jgi:hypothetical protein
MKSAITPGNEIFLEAKNDGDAWFSMYNKRNVKPVQPDPFFILKLDEHQWNLLKARHSHSVEKYRTSNIKTDDHGRGQFTYCGCLLKSCKVNCASSNHYCGFCLHRIHGFCLDLEGTYGVCHKCFVANYPHRDELMLIASQERKDLELGIQTRFEDSVASEVVATTQSNPADDIPEIEKSQQRVNARLQQAKRAAVETPVGIRLLLLIRVIRITGVLRIYRIDRITRIARTKLKIY